MSARKEKISDISRQNTGGDLSLGDWLSVEYGLQGPERDSQSFWSDSIAANLGTLEQALPPMDSDTHFEINTRLGHELTVSRQRVNDILAARDLSLEQRTLPSDLQEAIEDTQRWAWYLVLVNFRSIKKIASSWSKWSDMTSTQQVDFLQISQYRVWRAFCNSFDEQRARATTLLYRVMHSQAASIYAESLGLSPTQATYYGLFWRAQEILTQCRLPSDQESILVMACLLYDRKYKRLEVEDYQKALPLYQSQMEIKRRVYSVPGILHWIAPYSKRDSKLLAVFNARKQKIVEAVAALNARSLDQEISVFTRHPQTGDIERYVFDQDIPGQEDVFDDVAQEELRLAIEEAFERLSLKEQDVLKMRFGFPPYERQYSLEEVGRHFNIGKEGVRKTEARALRKLRRPWASRYLKDYLE